MQPEQIPPVSKLFHKRVGKSYRRVMEMVARDGLEPPTPAFSGLLIDKAKRFRINGNHWWKSTYVKRQLVLIGMV